MSLGCECGGQVSLSLAITMQHCVLHWTSLLCLSAPCMWQPWTSLNSCFHIVNVARSTLDLNNMVLQDACPHKSGSSPIQVSRWKGFLLFPRCEFSLKVEGFAGDIAHT